MKKYLFLLLAAFVFSSCEKAEPGMATLKLYGSYNGWGGKSADNGSTVYIFEDINMHFTDLKFDGKESLTNGTKVVKYNHTLILDEYGRGEISLKKGTHTFVCISKGSKKTMMVSFNLQKDSDTLDFDFPL